MTAPTKGDVAAAADVIRALLATVDAADFVDPREATVVHRLEGALLGLDVATGRQVSRGP